MRSRLVLKEIVSVALAVVFVVLLSIPLGPLPPLGNLLNPNGGVWTTAEGAKRPVFEELRIAGLDGDVTVLRDTWGVPHVFATTNHDLFLALGYVHAQDRMWQMDIQYRFAAGRLSEVLGKSFVEQDTFMRTVGLERDAEKFVASLPPGDIQSAALSAYAAGVNAWIDRESPRNLPLEFKLLNYEPEPWTPVHSLTEGELIAFGLSADFTDVELGLLVNALGQAAVDELFPANSPLQVPIVPNGTRGGGTVIDPDAGGDLLAKARLIERFLRPLRSIGSNNWVVAGNRSGTGRPILAGDPHLRFQLPAVWYEVHLKGGDYDIYGVTFPGIPSVFIGFNRFLANSETNTGADVTDFYRETVNPANPYEYRFQDAWRRFNVTNETIRVRGGAGVTVEVKESIHGPLLTERGEPVAMRWTGREFGTTLKASLLYMKARTWTEFRDALRFWANPAQNFAVAASDGTIAIRSNGLFPIRNNTLGRVPLDGASGGFEWTGWVPFDQYPEAVNPAQGYLASANQLPAGSPYPHYLGWQWDPGYRARRINNLLRDTIRSNGTVSFGDMKAFQGDTLDTAAEAFVPLVLNATRPSCIMPTKPPICAAFDALRGWDFRMDTGSVAATVWNSFYLEFLNDTFGDEWAAAGAKDLMKPAPNVLEELAQRNPSSRWFDDVRTPEVETRDDIFRRAMTATFDDLTARLGPIGAPWEWGRVHTRLFEHLSSLDALSRGPYPSEGDAVTLNPAGGLVARAGPSWRMVVDVGAPENSVTIYPGGQSGNPLSPHFDDMLILWRQQRYKDILFPTTAGLPAGRLESTLILRRV